MADMNKPLSENEMHELIRQASGFATDAERNAALSNVQGRNLDTEVEEIIGGPIGGDGDHEFRVKYALDALGENAYNLKGSEIEPILGMKVQPLWDSLNPAQRKMFIDYATANAGMATDDMLRKEIFEGIPDRPYTRKANE